MMPRAFLVFGPESSGNRLMLRLLIAAGCQGSATHRQPFDFGIPDPPPELLCWGKSFPSANRWPNISSMAVPLQAVGYEVHALVMTRNMFCTAHSQREHNHVRRMSQGYDNQQEAYKRIFVGLAEDDIPFTVVHYDELIRRPWLYLSWLFAQLGLDMPERLPAIRGENAKHWEAA